MNKKSLILTLILVFLSSCSLFQKDNQEQVSTLLDTQEQQEVIIQDEQELQNEEISQT
ncbi:MAG: hypothetical protein LBC61_00965 [Candidatus Peribacteria bacterium]|jgi:protein involved in sex pheromone biosynthesis|nr:hypothetical protein [Candidatus Peribacteria bacterium]